MAKTTTIDPAAGYHVDLIRPAKTPAMTYRPGVQHTMTGALILRLLAAAGLDEARIAEFGHIEKV